MDHQGFHFHGPQSLDTSLGVVADERTKKVVRKQGEVFEEALSLVIKMDHLRLEEDGADGGVHI
jgi:hypothetical protein